MSKKVFKKMLSLLLAMITLLTTVIFMDGVKISAASLPAEAFVWISQLSELEAGELYVLSVDNVIPVGVTGTDPEMMVALSATRPADWALNLDYSPFDATGIEIEDVLLWSIEADGSGYKIKAASDGANDYLREASSGASGLGAAQTLYLAPGSNSSNGQGFTIRTGASSGNYLMFSNAYNPTGLAAVSSFVFGSGQADSVFRIYKFVEGEYKPVEPPPISVDFTGNEWNSNTVYAINREDPHAHFVPYSNEADALKYYTLYTENSDYYKSLDGDWKFRWDHNPANRRTEANQPGFTTLGFDDSGWDDTTVPKTWQASFDTATGNFKYDGFIYVTSGVPWSGTFRNPLTNSNVSQGTVTQPASPANYNPVATFRKKFTVPAQWKDENRSVLLHFAGVASNAYVYVNGYRVGYATDSFTAKDFNITPYLDYDGENILTVQVFRWNSQTWFEIQDMNRLSGIFRSVGLVARAKVSLYDVQTLTTPVTANNYSGAWNLNIKSLLRDFGATGSVRANARLEAKLYDADGVVVAQAASTSSPLFTTRQNRLGKDFIGADLEFNLNVNSPNLWSAEKPYLYKLVLTLKDATELSETTCIRIGFRETKILNFGTTNVRYLLNGSRIVFNGVNAHETNPETGWGQDLATIRKDIEIMKQNNLNAVRMSHYPHDTRYYDLCDEYGLYVMDEANIECHGATSVVASLAVVNAWGPSLRDRVNNMMHRTWNYPSVIIWSMGNENNSIASAAQSAWHGFTTEFAKAKDPSRTVHSQFLQNGNTSTTTAGAEWYSGMYATASGWTTSVNNAVRPTLQCEYAHSIGNTLGNFDEYMVVWENPKTSGGFIWDWVDQALWRQQPNNLSERYLSFGSDWTGTWASSIASSGCFLGNGLITAVRTERPQMDQVKYGYRMLKAGSLNMTAGTYVVSNKYSFTNANEYDMYWELKENGKVIQSGADVLNINPAPSGVATTVMTNATLSIPFTRPTAVKPGAEYIFNVIFKEKVDRLWAKAGHIVAENQMIVDFSQGSETAAAPVGAMTLNETASSVNIAGADFEVSINKTNGTISSYKYKGRDLLVAGPAPNFWRPYNDNETAWHFANSVPTTTNAVVNLNWRTTGTTRTTTTASIAVVETADYIRVTVPGTFPTPKVGATYTTVYTIYPNAEVNVSYTYTFGTQSSNHDYAPEIGSVMTVAKGFENMTWYGRRGETYVDRKSGYPVGLNECTVTDNFHEYLRVQETGMKVDTRWFALTDDDGFGMIFKGSGTIPTPPNSTTMVNTSLLQFNALHYSLTDMYPGTHNYHAYQIKANKREEITLRVAITSTGVGGDNAWGAYPLTAYRVNVNGKTYRYNYSILPVESLDAEFAGVYASASYSAGATTLQKYIGEIAHYGAEKYPGKAAELLTDAKALSAPNFATMTPLQDMYVKLVDAFNLSAFVAVYDTTGKLAGVSIVDAKALAEKGDTADFLRLSGLVVAPGYTAKAFLWDDIFIPLTTPIVLG